METRRRGRKNNNLRIRFKSHYVVWKQFREVFFYEMPNSLNRTMQYGNYGIYKQRKKENRGLNRTMQYGNCFFAAGRQPELPSLNRTMQYGNKKLADIRIAIQKFKSHYVVWKQGSDAGDNDNTNEFKSHYVVWKPIYESEQSTSEESLNRTMQYGNRGQKKNTRKQ